MPHPILNIADVELKPWPAAHLPAGETAQRFEARFGPIGALIGARKLGYKITAVPPGKSAFPFHNHHANEEMVFVLQGSGTVRIGARRYPLRTGDVVALPCGGTDTAHQVINTGSEELRYLAVSTAEMPEVAEYPDSGKFGVYAARPADADGKPRGLSYIGREERCLDYWEGE